jgi:uncharacterized protein YyaL (SSP411 family)
VCRFASVFLLLAAQGFAQPAANHAPAHTNRLIHEKSPYLLQHAHNPVDWRPWGQEAFDEARKQNKPIFLSVGYSTCHWCHVMERESFENEAIAAFLNGHFICIKVDREERPDVDGVYMSYIQATTGGGGWPMSVWLTPDLKPFAGGTYFPPDDRGGRAGLMTALERIAEAWGKDRQRILVSSENALAKLRKDLQPSPASGSASAKHALESGFFLFRHSFDGKQGGFGGAPKFPRPAVYNFLLRYYAATKNKDALDMVVTTLRAMAKGGMHDQLGGGFHRYSVDANWFQPHFEKMLYDQALLATSYLEAFQITGEVEFADSARRIFEYVSRDMQDADGAFYSAEDADSVLDATRPWEKGEGAFYVWSQPEIERVLGKRDSEYFCYRYGVNPKGNAKEDPYHELTGKNILTQIHSLEETARHFHAAVEEVSLSIDDSKRKLLARRSTRVPPQRDDKVLTGWNGLMISALAKGGTILNQPAYTQAARHAADFLLERLYDPKTGILLHRYRQQDAAIPGFLEDYAFFSQGLLDLYEADFQLPYLQAAIRLTEKQIELFEDRSAGGFFGAPATDPSLLVRIKDAYDGAEPSGNSVTAYNLFRLAQITDRQDFRESAGRLLAVFARRMEAAPATVPQLLAAYQYSISRPKQIVLVGHEGLPTMLRELNSRFLPHKIVLLVDGESSRKVLSAYLPVVENMTEKDGKATAYVCENYTCRLPTADPKKFAELLQAP